MKRSTGTGRFVNGGGQDRGTGKFVAKTRFEKQHDLWETIKSNRKEVPNAVRRVEDAFNREDLDQLEYYASDLKTLCKRIMRLEKEYNQLIEAHRATN